MSESADRRLTEDGVTAATADALRAAMRRLFTGKPHRTDGRLTKDNLWREAGVSRATMNRAHTILTEWDTHLSENGSTTPGETRRDDEIRMLRTKLAERTHEVSVLGKRLDAAATAIAALHNDNILLREELAASNATVIPLRARQDLAGED